MASARKEYGINKDNLVSQSNDPVKGILFLGGNTYNSFVNKNDLWPFLIS